MADYDARKMTWAALLGRWIEFARSAVALPDNAEGTAWKKSVPAIIALQAVAMALGEAEQLEADQRALGIDRSRLLIERHTAELHEAFGQENLHPMLIELIDEARAAVEKAEGR